jgi:hypothetical protein
MRIKGNLKETIRESGVTAAAGVAVLLNDAKTPLTILWEEANSLERSIQKILPP